MWLERYLPNRENYISDISDANFKRVLIATVLSICPGLGQVYAGYLYRGLFGFLGLACFSWISAILILFVESRLFSFLILCTPFIYAFALAIDAAFCAVRNPVNIKSTKLPKWFLITVFLFMCAGVIILMDHLVGKNIVRAFIVSSGSMYPNIIKWDVILVDKIKSPKKGDIVLLDFSNSNTKESISNIIKNQTLRRIIAVQGETVEIRGKRIYINNSAIIDKYAYYGNSDSHNIYTHNNYQWGPVIVPPYSFFVLTDSRLYGFDSRTFGFINNSHINGVASKVLWSWNLDDRHFKWERTVLNIE